MEHISSSALLHLSHWLYLCTYYDSVYIIVDIIKPEPQLKRGLYLFPIMCGYMELVCLKAASGLPLEFALKKQSFIISLGGLVVSEPMQHLLIGESHQITWGHGQV